MKARICVTIGCATVLGIGVVLGQVGGPLGPVERLGPSLSAEAWWPPGCADYCAVGCEEGFDEVWCEPHSLNCAVCSCGDDGYPQVSCRPMYESEPADDSESDIRLE